MFYSSEILSLKSNSNLGIVWLAATLGPKSNAKRLGRKELTPINIPQTCAFLTAPPSPLSLRLSANLMMGVTRIYGQQYYYHFNDVQGLCTKISLVNKPADPDAIDLASHEKKGTNITLKKIDCISAVNVLPGDPLNFPDLDISNLLVIDNNNNNNSRRSSITSSTNSMLQSTEIGRKNSFLLSTPFSNSSSSNNALQGSDFASVTGDDHDIHGDDDFLGSDLSHFMHLKPKSDQTPAARLFQVPAEIRKRKRPRNLKNAFMDHQELMLEKDQLFINDHDMLSRTLYNEEITKNSDPLKEALRLLNNPEGLFYDPFESIFIYKPQFTIKISSSTVTVTVPAAIDELSQNISMDMNDQDIEVFRRDSTTFSNGSNTPSILNLPWSSSSKHSVKSGSSFMNTPIRKGSLPSSTAGQSTPSPLMGPFGDLRLSESISPFKTIESNQNISHETIDFFFYLQETIETANRKNNRSITFKSVLDLHGTSRPVAARAFHHLLELKSASLIQVNQLRPFADIQISIN